MADLIDKTRQTLIFNPIYHAYAGAAFALLQARFATIRFISAIPLFQLIIFKAARVWPEIFLGKNRFLIAKRIVNMACSNLSIFNEVL
ncbi:hypothetical protein AFK69_17500 [Xenorhabdus sp. GDc328]|uniref:hypothetical protein n=1 Tax=Xenorhabdus TaxID=626 RepID=UPI00064A14F8|nr:MULTISPECIES: hypothetical protein [Xenorhabdus]KLU14962.1 hypothetical protein AAY47_13505 [Xenorhabdus griffiniae]KOP32065.1 hypothetical protein AFK69_17500 [Xenorhabdus sp. GDc328]